MIAETVGTYSVAITDRLVYHGCSTKIMSESQLSTSLKKDTYNLSDYTNIITMSLKALEIFSDASLSRFFSSWRALSLNVTFVSFKRATMTAITGRWLTAYRHRGMHTALTNMSHGLIPYLAPSPGHSHLAHHVTLTFFSMQHGSGLGRSLCSAYQWDWGGGKQG